MSRRQSVKYMTIDATEERSSGSPSGRRKTIRESLQSDQIKLTLAKQASSPTKRTSSQSRNKLYLAATGKQPAHSFSRESQLKNDALPGLGMAKNALQHKLNHKAPVTDNKQVNSQIHNLKKLIDEAETNNSRSILQQIKILEEKVDDKVSKAVKSLESRIDEIQESIFGLQSATMDMGPNSQNSPDFD